MSQTGVTAGKAIPHEINVIIKIPVSYYPINYHVDGASGALHVANFQSTSMHYPCNYGYIPHTLCEQGSPLNVLAITPIRVHQHCVVRCRPLGALALIENGRLVRKIVAVPINKLTDCYQHIQKIDDLGQALLQKIVHFFTHYKDLEQASSVRFEGWLNSEAAENEIMMGVMRFEKQHEVSMAV